MFVPYFVSLNSTKGILSIKSYHPTSQVHVNGFEQFPWTHVLSFTAHNGILHIISGLDHPGKQRIFPCPSQ